MTTKGPHHDSTGTLQEDIRIDITVPHHPDLQDCGLRVLQYQAIIGAAVAQHPDILDGPFIRLQEFLRVEVLPQLKLVNAASTARYYSTLCTAIRQQLWTVAPKLHQTWPDPTRITQKRKHSKSTSSRRHQEQSFLAPSEAHKKYRQLQLWEVSQTIEISDSPNPKNIQVAQLANSQEGNVIMEGMEHLTQVQWLHRWFDESTQEELTPLPETATWTGSPILRFLARHKQQEHRRRRLL